MNGWMNYTVNDLALTRIAPCTHEHSQEVHDVGVPLQQLLVGRQYEGAAALEDEQAHQPYAPVVQVHEEGPDVVVVVVMVPGGVRSDADIQVEVVLVLAR